MVMQYPSSSEKKISEAVIATQRFALGAHPNELKNIKGKSKQWLLKQLDISPTVQFDNSLPNANQILAIHSDYRKALKQARQNRKESPINPHSAIYKQLSADSLQQSINSENSFNWRCLDFFSNHFSVTAQGQLMRGLAATLEREAIAPNLFGHFEDLLLAVCQHPAMLIYLNNETSIGPSTPSAKNNKGLNENLAREIMELHTLGVNGGYQQQDVTELAKGITGWSVSTPGKDKHEGFIYRAHHHEPGSRNLMGKNYSEQGFSQGEAMLRDLAKHPSTVKFISTKIIQHFVSDQAPEILVNHLIEHWQNSNGHLKTVLKALINHPLAWQTKAQKYKTPREYVVSTYRALAIKNLSIEQVQSALSVLGQQPFNAGSPAGYSDQEQDWNGGNALIARVNWASQLAAKKQLRTINIETLIENLFGHSLSTHSYEVITRAESRQQALTLLLLSPEFLRR
jgi:uncharacterized protein (DUF1800 family)